MNSRFSDALGMGACLAGDSSTSASVSGSFDPAFDNIATAFAANFDDRGEVGASVCIHHGGRRVVDLWGGVSDPASGRPWTADTMSIVFSTTKGATALCIHLLAAEGLLDLDAPVTAVWPEFGQAGKADITVQMLLDHTAGIPTFRDPVKPDALEDIAYLVARLERERPYWRPGTACGYHAVTFGIALGEVVRRVTGRTLGRYFDDAIAGPLGLDFWIGLPERCEPRVAAIVAADPSARRDTPFLRAARDEPDSIAHGVVHHSGEWSWRGVPTRAGRAAEIGAAGGVTNARALAALYASLLPGHAFDGDGLDTLCERIARRARRQCPVHDATLLMPTRFADGFMLSVDNTRERPDGHSLLIGPDAFGHAGAGGSVGFVDLRNRFAFAYTMNRMGPGVLLNRRGQSLIDATYRAIDRLTADATPVVRPYADPETRP